MQSVELFEVSVGQVWITISLASYAVKQRRTQRVLFPEGWNVPVGRRAGVSDRKGENIQDVAKVGVIRGISASSEIARYQLRQEYPRRRTSKFG